MKKRGFTLVEMLGVILLLGILALIAVPTVNVIIRNNKENALSQTIKTIEDAAYNYSINNDIGYSSKTKILQISELKESGLLKNEKLMNPVTDSELEGCVLYRWDDNYKQYNFTYDEECEIIDFTVEIKNKTGEFNENGWANKDFYVSIETNGTSYNYCIDTKKCSPKQLIENSKGTTDVTIESETVYVCAYANYKKASSEIVCSEVFKLDKTSPIAGTIDVKGTMGENDWYISDVTIKTIDGTDNLSGHLETTVEPVSITKNTSGDKVVVTTKDKADNVSTREYTIKIDKDEPTVTLTKKVENNKNVIVANTNSMTSGYSYEWYKDGEKLNGETNSTLATTTSGKYKVKVTTGSGKKAESNELEIKQYTITYDMNGGVGTIANQIKIQDLTLTLSNTKPTLRGYTFIGWSTDKNATKETYKSGGTYTDNKSVTLYAIYSVNSYVCSAGEYLDKSAIECKTCEAGSYCPGGTYNYSSSVQGKITCPGIYIKSASGSDAASDCYAEVASGKYINTYTATSLSTCLSGSYCSGGNVYYNQTGKITTCPGIYKNSASGSDSESDCYIKTDGGKHIASSKATSQTTCEAGYYCPSATIYYGQTGTRTTCPAGSYCPQGSASATKCPSGYTSVSGSDAQTDCYLTTTGGKYIATANTSTQTTCTSGYYCPSATIYYGQTGTRTTCPAGSYCPQGSASATKCPSGYTSVSGSDAQTDCYLTTTGGKYIATANTSTQTTCTSGYYCPSATIYYGQTGTRTTCPAGSYCPQGSASATKCPSGYTSVSGSDAQTDCYLTTTGGKYIATANTSTQTTCTSGYYCPSTTVYYGQTGTRTTCPAGSYCPQGSASATKCPSGYTSVSGSDAQTDCYLTTTGGKYIATANTSTQTTCTSGYYCPSTTVYYGQTGTRTTCPAGSYCPQGSASATKCPSGYTSVSGSDAQTDCYLTTTGGKYIATANTSTQTTCTSGYYCPSTTVYYGQTGTRTICPSSHPNSSSGSDSISDCYKTVTVTYNGNGATSGTMSNSTCSAYYSNNSCQITLSGSNYAKTNHTFQGWGTGSTAVSYNASQKVSFSSDTMLYAIWKINYSCAVGELNGDICIASNAQKYYTEKYYTRSENTFNCNSTGGLTSCSASGSSSGLSYTTCSNDGYSNWKQTGSSSVSSCSGYNTSTSQCSGTTCTTCSSTPGGNYTTYTATDHTRTENSFSCTKSNNQTSCTKSGTVGSGTSYTTCSNDGYSSWKQTGTSTVNSCSESTETLSKTTCQKNATTYTKTTCTTTDKKEWCTEYGRSVRLDYERLYDKDQSTPSCNELSNSTCTYTECRQVDVADPYPRKAWACATYTVGPEGCVKWSSTCAVNNNINSSHTLGLDYRICGTEKSCTDSTVSSCTESTNVTCTTNPTTYTKTTYTRNQLYEKETCSRSSIYGNWKTGSSYSVSSCSGYNTSTSQCSGTSCTTCSSSEKTYDPTYTKTNYSRNQLYEKETCNRSSIYGSWSSPTVKKGLTSCTPTDDNTATTYDYDCEAYYECPTGWTKYDGEDETMRCKKPADTN